MLEDYYHRVYDLLSKLDLLKESLTTGNLPDDLNSAKLALEEQNLVKKKIMKAPIDAMENEGQRIVERMCGSGRRGRHPSELLVSIARCYKWGDDDYNHDGDSGNGSDDDGDVGNGSSWWWW